MATLLHSFLYCSDNGPIHLVFNGTSCSGKSTIAHHITTLWKSKNVAYHHVSIDRLYSDMLNSLSDCQKNDLPTLLTKAQEKNTTHPVMAFEMWPDYMNNLFEKWFTSYFDTIKNSSFSILELVCDHDSIMKKFIQLWKANNKPPLTFVKIYCLKEVAQERLKIRNASSIAHEHRDGNTVEANYNCLATIHGFKNYDLEIDTSFLTAASAAELVINSSLATNAMNLNSEILQ